jgi:MYXO-CTERM domain-containing protein
MYGSDFNNNRPNTYAGIINEKCEQLAAPQMVSIPRNANDGAPDISYVGNGLFVGAYYSDGGDGPGFPGAGGDYAVAMGLQVNSGAVLPTLTRSWIQPAIMGGAIMRPSVAVMSDSRVLVAASQGGNRPSVNSEVALLDTHTGTKVFSSPISKGDPDKKIYFNSPTIKKLSPDPLDHRAVMLDWESNGMGKGTNIKGTSKTHLYMLELNGDSLNVVSETTDVGAHQTHASLCTGAYGEKGERTAGIFTAAPTGIGRATMSMFASDASNKFIHDVKADAWPAAWYGDSGHLSNWYGANPMRQGRDFMWCIGDVPNPGYHVPGGFMSDVKSLFVGTVHGRVPGDAKNSLFLSLIPGQMDKKSSPTNPIPAGETPALDPNAGLDPNTGGPDAASGCGCSTPGQTSRGPAGALLGLIALGLVISVRRRKA